MLGTDRVLAAFIEHVSTEAGRCAACHSPDQNQIHVQKHGEQVSWIKPAMQVEHGGGQKMVAVDRAYKQFRRFIDDYAASICGIPGQPIHSRADRSSGESLGSTMSHSSFCAAS